MAISAAETEQLREAVRDLLADRCTESDVRRVMASDSGYDPQLWKQLAELGLPGLLIATEYGGVGLGAEELEAVSEEIGAALLPSPFLSSAVLTSTLIDAAGSEEDKRRLLPALADGSSIGTVAVSATWTPESVAVQANGTLTGTTPYVTFGQVADVILVVARTGDDIGIFEVAPDASGFTRTAESVFDPTVRLSQFTFADTPARRIGTAGWEAVQKALDVSVIALAGEQAGGARQIFETTVDYLKTRVQFGRAIGSFQAMKHLAADRLLDVESATSAARHAAADGSPGAIALAGFACAEAYETVALSAIQMHGGVGFTWEHPAHLYLRRARSGAQLFGGSRLHRERYLVSKGA
ncbi:MULTISPECIES: acyl-CoA dehydrogenase family protein [Amycolatopsis]|uniref:acyl-CoA dehydrogenase family protein n=1 Tax=Amycolatopsis TaxID=1813 RepID=UPI00106F8712|nr:MULTISPECIES: acyl-CoA dehydrogenase family protein [Amycolatopsis]MCG3752925.1 acyl-CoA/acyl-ACP dehydrogenase [Amycolatopsis sp. Poz14]